VKQLRQLRRKRRGSSLEGSVGLTVQNIHDMGNGVETRLGMTIAFRNSCRIPTQYHYIFFVNLLPYIPEKSIR
jgi:hypothetical protein